jgi:hypothetical protein
MNILLDEFADNRFVDEMVFWSSQGRKVVAVKSIVPSEGECRIEARFEDGSAQSLEYERGDFEAEWNESRTLVGAITGIDGDLRPLTADQIASLEPDRQEYCRRRMTLLVRKVADARRRCLAELNALFASGDYRLFLEQVGVPYGRLPSSLIKKIEYAKKHASEPTP